jgi:Pyruvate/2-oxoacid:ferredoxin oxidoreductase delta subunit
MAEKDLYADLCRFYEFMLGPIPQRAEFMQTLKDTVAADDLRTFFLLPFTGHIATARLEKKAKMPLTELNARLERLAHEGFVLIYSLDGERVYERGNPVYMTEQQVRKREDTPRRDFFAHFFDRILSGDAAAAAPNKTPYYRVLPVEAAVRPEVAGNRVTVNAPVPDPRAVLPTDVVSEMIRRDADIIGVADCYCRRTRRLVGHGCDKPLETCLVFGKIAQTLIDYGTARRIDLDEALRIVRECEAAGLVHNVDNCEGRIISVCNCCTCCSILLTSWKRGGTNADSPSRYVVAYDASRCAHCGACIGRCPVDARALAAGTQGVEIDVARCLGCGLCVSACANGANHMELRPRQGKLAPTADALWAKIGREAVVGIVLNKIRGK